MLAYASFPTASSRQMGLRLLVMLVCAAIAFGTQLSILLPAVCHADVSYSGTGYFAELPTEQAPGPQESSNDAADSNEMPEEGGATAVANERRYKRSARYKSWIECGTVSACQRLMQALNERPIFFEHWYRNGCGTHLRC